ncbi:MAG: acetoin utilization protein AcuC [Gammaproteobacteria bacterium]|nr:acetoin utilization protein AcuC [Gammaproteobacteria bacterium]
MQRKAIFVGSDLWREPGFGGGHPLSIPRVASVMNLCAALGWLEPEEFRDSPRATDAELAGFHDAGYIAALRAADAAGVASIPVRERYGIGTSENPLFPGVFARAAAAVGGSVLAADLALRGHVSFHPAGGTHHGRVDRAHGFCYFNDPVFALRRLAQAGLTRMLYVDLDAHHGDGVQDAVRDDPRIHTISIHERNRWPFTGAADDRGGGRSRNYPVPAGFNDTELRHLMQRAVLPFAAELEPQAVVIVCGTDALAADPLSRLALSNAALWGAVEDLVGSAPVAMVLGGGGYNPWTVARCWTGLWARLSGREPPAILPAAARRVLEALSCDLIDDCLIDPAWWTTLADPPREGPVRPEVMDLAAGGEAPIGLGGPR